MNNIQDFGRRSLVNWTQKEIDAEMALKECESCGQFKNEMFGLICDDCHSGLTQKKPPKKYPMIGLFSTNPNWYFAYQEEVKSGLIPKE